MMAWTFLSSLGYLTVSIMNMCKAPVHCICYGSFFFWLIQGVKVYAFYGDTIHKPASLPPIIIAGDQKMPAGCRLFPAITANCQVQNRRGYHRRYRDRSERTRTWCVLS